MPDWNSMVVSMRGRSVPRIHDGSPVMCTSEHSNAGTLTSSRCARIVAASSVNGDPAWGFAGGLTAANRRVLYGQPRSPCAKDGVGVSGSLVRIGVLHDFPTADDGRSFEQNLRLGLQTVVDSGRLDDQIEIVHAAGLGLPLPGGSAYAVERAFVELAEQGVAAIVGPAISDNAIVVQPLADRACIPTLNYTGSEETRSEYGFQYQLGSLEDEPSFLASHLVARGLTRVAIERDRSYVGRRMADFFEHAAGVAGLSITARGAADAIASLGMWDSARTLAQSRPSVPV